MGRSSVNLTQSSIRYIRSSFPRDASFQSSHSRSELIVRKSSIVILSLRGSGFCSGWRSGKYGRIVAWTPGMILRSIAIPISAPVIVFVHERVLCRVAASAPLK